MVLSPPIIPYMNHRITSFLLLLGLFLCLSCQQPNPNLDESGIDPLDSLSLDHEVDRMNMPYRDLIYVPIYSEIYMGPQTFEASLTTTLSIRNTSRRDSLFVSQIDFFNTAGVLVKHFIDQPISLPPMATVNYVIGKNEEVRGDGASFLVALSANQAQVNPLIQAVMIGEYSNKAFAWSIDGYSIRTSGK